jgi:hypothetical protein
MRLFGVDHKAGKLDCQAEDFLQHILQAEWLAKNPQLVGHLDVPCSIALAACNMKGIPWAKYKTVASKAEQLEPTAAIVLLRRIASPALAPRTMHPHLQQPAALLLKLGTQYL